MGWELFKNYLIAKEKFKPDFFLYENNKSAAQAIKEQIKQELKVHEGTIFTMDNDAHYIEINSALVSAQSRKRFYVHNCGDVKQPEDRGIILRDILENNSDIANADRSNKQELAVQWGKYADGKGQQGMRAYAINGKSCAVRTCGAEKIIEPVRIGTMPQNNGILKDNQATRIYSTKGKSTTLSANGGGWGAKTGLYAVPICHTIPQEVTVRKYTCELDKFKAVLREHKTLSNKQIAEKLNKPLTLVEHWFRKDDCFSVPDADIWFELKKILNIETTEYDDFVTVFETKSGVFEKANRCYDINGKMSTLMTTSNDKIIAPNDGETKPVYEVKNKLITIKGKEYPIKLADGSYIIRKLTVKECCRLQTMPDDYCRAVSDAQAYKGLGNGWTAEVIIHILNEALKSVPKDEEIVVLSMYDGIGTGRYCLDKMGFTNVKYYAYEIDKYAMQISNSNYPDIIQMGDAFQVRKDDWKL